MIIFLTVSSIGIIVKLINLKRTKQQKEESIYATFISKSSKQINSKAVQINNLIKSEYSSLAEMKYENTITNHLVSKKNKNEPENNMIAVLAFATLFFNLVYLVSFVRAFHIESMKKENLSQCFYSRRSVVAREVVHILILFKYSIMSLLFFVSGQNFRIHLCQICKIKK
jgi:hypothetical protein